MALALDKYYVVYEKRSLYNSDFKAFLPNNGVLASDKILSDSLRTDIGLLPLNEAEFIHIKEKR